MDLTSTLRELLLVEHFRAPLPLTVLDMADWAREFSMYPKAQQLQWAPPVDISGPGPVTIAFGPQSESPRLLLRSESGERMIQLQSDRLGFGWSRNIPIGERAEYPGFETIKREFALENQKFRAWCAQRIGVAPKLKLVEIGYNNAAPIIADGGKRRRLSDIFRWVQPARPVNSFQVSWAELLQTDRPDAPRVLAVVAVGSAPPVAEALLFNFTGFAPIDDDTDSSALVAFDRLHQRILDMYESAIVRDGEDAK